MIQMPLKSARIVAPVSALLMLLLGFSPGTSLAQEPLTDLEPPAVKMVDASLIAPADAWTYYDQSAAQPDIHFHTNGVAYSATRAPEIREIARALGAGRLSDQDFTTAVYEYVRNNIKPDFRFGLSKGAIGAIIDQSGTAFDQAHLMVELLREGAVDVSYKLGTISPTPTQFSDWTGVSNASAACKFLASGGIPGAVNGTSTCAGLSGSVTSITMGHIWVSVGGQLYDPAYKKQIKKTGLDLAAAMQCGNAAAPTCATPIMAAIPQTQTYPGTSNVPYLRNANHATIQTQLKSNAVKLQNHIQGLNTTGKTNLQIEDVVGGMVVDTAAPFASGPALSYPSAVRYTWAGGIPDQYRTTLRVQYDTINVKLYSDESYGKRLRIWGGWPKPDSQQRSTGTTSERAMALYLEYRPLAKAFSPAGSPLDELSLTINHPYSAAAVRPNAEAGSYADERIDQRVTLQNNACYFSNSGCGGDPGTVWYFGSLTILQNLGETSESAASYFAALQRRDFLDMRFENPTDPNHIQMLNADTYYRSSSCWTRSFFNQNTVTAQTRDNLCYGIQQATMGATWTAQATQARKLIAGIAASTIQHHHSLGYVLSGHSISGANINVESSVSITSNSAVAIDRQAAFKGMASALSRMEGGLFEQQYDNQEGGSGVSLLARSNSNALYLLSVNASNAAEALPKLLNYASIELTTIQRFIADGYTLLLPHNGDLGSVNALTYLFNGFAAYGPSGDRIAYLLSDFDKGSAGTNPVTDPAQSVLESTKFRENSVKDKQYYGVNLQSGDLKLTPPPDLVTGVGDFPYSLSFQRYYDSSTPLVDYLSAIYAGPASHYESANLGGGWKHNFSIAASINSDGMAGLGRNSALDASEAIAGLYMLKLLNLGSFVDPRSNLASVLVTHSWVNALNANIVNIRRPPANDVFVRLPSGAFNPKPGSNEKLVQTGERAAGSDNTWNYLNVDFTLTGAEGSVMALNWDRQNSPVWREREPTTWSFPSGVVLTFNSQYGNELRVVNNLGRGLGFDTEVGDD